MKNELYDVLIIGAGPAGLSCALEAQRCGLSAIVVDKGAICDSIRRFPTDMTFYSTTELLEIGGIPFSCPAARPTRLEVLEYYRLCAQRAKLNLALYTRVLGVSKAEKGFVVSTTRGEYRALNIVLSSGYFDTPNRLGVPGEDMAHVHPYYTDAYAYSGCKVLVVGGRNSAVETALDLWRHGAKVHIIHRGPGIAESVKYWQKPDIENRIKAGEISADFNTTIVEIRERSVVLRNLADNQEWELVTDFVIPHIGYRPDESLFTSLGLEYNPANLVAKSNPETYESSIPNIYLAGSVLCGSKVWNIFIENGREHAFPIIRSIIQKQKKPA